MTTQNKYIRFLVVAWMLIPLCMFAGEGSDTQVTIYNNNLGLVRQTRAVELQKGITELRIEGVSAKIDPTSVHFNFPKVPGRVEILEQNFQYDLVNAEKIFRKYIGETIQYRLENEKEVSGILLSSDGSNIILRLPDGSIRVAATRSIVDYEFPSLPEGLILQPTLQWLLNSEVKGGTAAELSYLTAGLSWHAEYVIVLETNERDLSIASWVSLENNSGATYENAKMKLIAGDIHRAPSPRNVPGYAEDMAVMSMAKGAAFEEREFFDYHLYDLQRPVTIRNNEIKQVTLFDEKQSKGDKIYIFQNSANRASEAPLSVELRIPNTESNRLGVPLPGGVARIFKKDIDKTLQLIGEDRLAHTSKNDTLELKVGEAFDVKGKHAIKDRTTTKTRSEILSVAITVSNRKNETIQVEVQEIQNGDWYVKSASHQYRKISNALLLFPLTVPPNQTVVVQYTFQRDW